MRASGKGKGEKKIRNELTEQQKREIEDAYEPFSETGIEPKELKLAMKALGFDPNNEEVQKIMAQVDKKGKTPISYADFLDIMIEKPTDNPQAEMKKAFKPEFLNRIDEIVMFKKLGKKVISGIVRLQLERVAKRLEGKRIKLDFDESSISFLCEKGYDPAFGARPVKRAVQSYLENPLAKEILNGNIQENSTIKVYQKGDSLAFD